MAKVGKAFVKIPDSFFASIENAYAPQLEATAKAVAADMESEAARRVTSSNVVPETSVTMAKNKNGRLTAIILLRHPGALALQARHGVMTRAAARNGLDVHRYKG